MISPVADANAAYSVMNSVYLNPMFETSQDRGHE